ncbi:MAG TPA: hypothetical protein VGZ00_08585 [Candidatus Baltobacteraceae bacterium]|jgi:hypothetical protein|nr:hypothetical protein [Candidatus Baltobacteraceae bacterium]
MDGGYQDVDAIAPVARSLMAQAANKTLPMYQYMDAATLAWIASHRNERPAMPLRPIRRLPPLAQRLLNAAPIPVSWHAETRLVDSIHGTRHLLRTTAFAAILAQLHKLNQYDTESLLVATAIHDCRRVHDKEDIGHGERGGAWLTEHADETFGFFGIDRTINQTQQAAIAVKLHEIPYSLINVFHRIAYDRSNQIIDILKTADALDRYRLPKLKWWPNDDLLRVVPPPWLHRIAFELVVETEMKWLEGMGSARAVRTILHSRGLL